MGKQNKMKYYHNNRCRKSREGLEFLATKNLNPAVYEYMKNPLTKKELLKILDKLKLKAGDLLRKNETIYKENLKGKNLTENQILDWMIKEPKLIERPILINGEKAVIGRPKENFLKIID
jgi:arsenate reductase